jgi:DNA mismatch repair protein MutS
LFKTAAWIAEIDTFAAWAELAEMHRYVRPALLPATDLRLEISNGRHPVIEALLQKQGSRFIPNSVTLDSTDCQLALITGPNMAGKSTIMRQVALIQLLAQAGCFVPADLATLSLCDRIFTRVGASDDAKSGRSTFMVEMTETAHILNHSTAFSLVLLDEIGRGTSTFDGLSIAWAVAEHLHNQTKARTMFATHYHELTKLSESLSKMRNLQVAVSEKAGEIRFLYTLQEGAAERSYGIQVASLAGLPKRVLERASEVLESLEQDKPAPKVNKPKSVQLPLFADPLRMALKGFDVNASTPMQALSFVAGLKEL